MVHRRLLKDDRRGVQEPLNETMCGCGDRGAQPGQMADRSRNGCVCAGLTVRGSAYLIIDKVDGAHATRRQLVEKLNFPPTLAFQNGNAPDLKVPAFSAVASELPPQIRLMTLTSNYADFNGV